LLKERSQTAPEVEDRYKLTFNQIDKRFVNLELAVGELNENLKKALDQTSIDDLKQRLDDVEDLIMVENAGVIELKNMLEPIQESLENPKEIKFSTSPEDIEKFAKSILPRLESSILSKIDFRIHGIEEKIKSTPLESDVSQIKSHIDSVLDELKGVVTETRKEIENLKDSVQPMDKEIVKKIVSEISDVRLEFGKEVMYLKEKVEGERTTKSDIDLKFLSSRVNTLKDSVDFLVNRKTELDQKIENLENMIAQLPSKAENILSADVMKKIQDNKGELEFANLGSLYDRLSALEDKVSSLETTTEKPKNEKEVSNFLDKQIDELLDKIISLDTRIGILERTLTTGKRRQPVILE
jgi:prefoldin subunit 5